MALQFNPGYREANAPSRNQPELAIPGLLEELKKKVNRPVPELPLSEDTDIVDLPAGNGNGNANGVSNGNGNGNGHSTAHALGSAPKPAFGALKIKTLSDSVAHFQQDAPPCPKCGHVAVAY